MVRWWRKAGGRPTPPISNTRCIRLARALHRRPLAWRWPKSGLTVDDKVVSFFPNEVPATVSANLAAMRVKDLLTMATGHDKDSTGALRSDPDQNWVKAFLAQPVEHEPGTFFVYNSGATYMLSAIIQKVTGQPLLVYLKPRLFDPLGIEGADWETDPKGIATGGWGLRVRTEDIAKFGQLYLKKGLWNGKRILPEAWIEDATKFQIQSKGGSRPKEENDWLQGYGYQFWAVPQRRVPGGWGLRSILHCDAGERYGNCHYERNE